MTRLPFGVLCLLLLALAQTYGQQVSGGLRRFFEARLADGPDTAPPEFRRLLAVVDPISQTSQSEIEDALGVLRLALKSQIRNLPVEAGFAYFAISGRPDGGKLLRDSIPQFAELLMDPDERLSGASISILQNLTHSIPETTVPVLVDELRRAGPPNLVKASVAQTLLRSARRDDPAVLRVVDAYLSRETNANVKVANLQAVASNKSETPMIVAFVMKALGDRDKHVQMAAIRAIGAMSATVRRQARETLRKLADDPATDPEVRRVAVEALQD